MLDIIEDYLETVNVFKGSDVSLGDLDYVDEATVEFLLYKFKRELKRLPQFLEIALYDLDKVDFENDTGES